MQFNILCVLTLLVAFVASAAVPEAAPDVTSTYGTWFDVEDFDVTNFKLATRDEEDAIVVAALTLIAAILINARWAPAWGLEGGLKCDTCILVDSMLGDILIFVQLSGAYHEFVLDEEAIYPTYMSLQLLLTSGLVKTPFSTGSPRLCPGLDASRELVGRKTTTTDLTGWMKMGISMSGSSDDENDDGDDVCPIAEVMKDKSSQDFIHEVIILKFTEVIDETMKYIHWALAQLYRTCIPCQ
ncbi:hypothetical protein M747DRAFT_327862 [Aspergillus niger ATCC 13496]|uniref:Uncharacterized protein n=1 Tax=Aspergillus niger ATCC 13496 TaxID=1353008 RepID=A0A370CDJ7_ASPNG|nr:hypothetical protein M747DRAFT_327862 [Aspergillus niger ATCC 13496]